MHLLRLRVRSDMFPVRDAYPFCLEILQSEPILEFSSPIVCFHGENGSGKSTLLMAMARACGLYICRVDCLHRLDPNRYEDGLQYHLDLEWREGPVPGSYFGSDIFRDFARVLEERAVADPGQLAAFGGHSLLNLSHGQSLMSYFRARYAIEGIYFLDEPETGLSPSSQLELAEVLRAAAGSGRAQFFIASHSPFILSMPEAELWCFDKAPLARLPYRESRNSALYSALFSRAAG